MKHKKVPLRDALVMLSGYARSRIVARVKSVAFIIIYLVVFQALILRVPLSNALLTAAGIGLVILGLAFFLEGLVLGFMPLGERVGVKLPTRTGIFVISVFGLILGIVATLAEPAISALRVAGSTVTAWESPLLYMVLHHYAEWLILSVGIGVGVAVAMGMFRFYYNLSIKPFILIIVPVLLILTVLFSYDPNLNGIIGLAWDCGAVTTGAVTVPLVLALGIGVSRAAGKGKGTSSGFGIVLLASALPVLAVYILGYFLSFKAPSPSSETSFFSVQERKTSLTLFENEHQLRQHAFTHGTEKGRKSFFASNEAYETAILSIRDNPAVRDSLLGDITPDKWIFNIASESEREMLSGMQLTDYESNNNPELGEVFKAESLAGIRAVIPLSVLLIIVLTVFLREKLRYKDEVVIGIVFTLLGMIMLTSGIKLGLARLGGEVGEQLPGAFSSKEEFIDRIIINNFDKNLLYSTITSEGDQKIFFNYFDNGRIRPVEFHEEHFDEASGRYEHIITRPPLFSNNLSVLGIILVLLFAFGLGYGATLAEPALNALGMTVEGITVGTIKKTHLIQLVAIGVGAGILAGLCRILFDLPLVWLIVISYVLLIPLTILSDEELTEIAWDSGGVTTGPVTVPLVLAMGLSISGELNIPDGFGVLALASVFPIMTVLIYGLFIRAKQRRSIPANRKNPENE